MREETSDSSEILQKEAVFHDAWAQSLDPGEVWVDESFETCSTPEARLIMRWLGNIEGKRILDLGSGAGEAAVYFAKKGALVTASDISPGMLKLVEKVAEKHQTRLNTLCCSADAVPLPDQSFDIVHAANLLHHVAIENTILEAKRLLVPGGIFVSWDPLAHNPAINIYRRMASQVRTVDEHPIQFSQLKLFKTHFSEFKYTAYWFFTLLIFFKFFFIDRVHPNKERYWKKIIKDRKKIESLYVFLEKLDRSFLKLFPFMQRYCWNIVLFCRK